MNQDPSRPWSRALLPVAGLLSMGLAVYSLSSPRELLAAAPSYLEDSDGDGLVDAQELIQQTSPFVEDTDGDGYSDLEELARGSCPFRASDVPLPGDIGLALTARGEPGSIHVTLLVYYTDGTMDDKYFGFGIVANGRVIPIPASQVLADASIGVLPTMDGTGDVAVVEFTITSQHVEVMRRLSFFATMSLGGEGRIAAAAVLDFAFTSDGILMMNSPSYASTGSGADQGGSSSTVYQPIVPVEESSVGWGAGRICFQRTLPVSYENGVVVNRIVTADCSDGWDSYCSPQECKASVGDEYATIDPIGLVGG